MRVLILSLLLAGAWAAEPSKDEQSLKRIESEIAAIKIDISTAWHEKSNGVLVSGNITAKDKRENEAIEHKRKIATKRMEDGLASLEKKRGDADALRVQLKLPTMAQRINDGSYLLGVDEDPTIADLQKVVSNIVGSKRVSLRGLPEELKGDWRFIDKDGKAHLWWTVMPEAYRTDANSGVIEYFSDILETKTPDGAIIEALREQGRIRSSVVKYVWVHSGKKTIEILVGSESKVLGSRAYEIK